MEKNFLHTCLVAALKNEASFVSTVGGKFFPICEDGACETIQRVSDIDVDTEDCFSRCVRISRLGLLVDGGIGCRNEKS